MVGNAAIALFLKVYAVGADAGAGSLVCPASPSSNVATNTALRYMGGETRVGLIVLDHIDAKRHLDVWSRRQRRRRRPTGIES